MKKRDVDVVVIGAGPGGYAAAFYAADKGKSVILIEKEDLGGVCLNRGCIPSKALLHIAHTIEEAEQSESKGLSFGKPQIDLDKIRDWKNGIISKLSGGIATLAKARGVDVIKGKAFFESSEELRVETQKGQEHIEFKKAILATGSRPALPAAFDLGNPRIMTSTEALNIEDIPEKLLVVGAGYIGMELGTVYASMGSSVTMVEAMPEVMAGADRDLVRPLLKVVDEQFESIRLSYKVEKMATVKKQIKVTMSDESGTKINELYDRVLVSIGRQANHEDIGLENTGIKQDEKGFVLVNTKQETTDANIYAIGDICGGALLAHKASKEARIAVENICGETAVFEDIHIPAVVYTEPEIAWVGLTETEAKKQSLKVKVAKFPWSASGRALTFDKPDGLTKLIIEPDTERILGVGIVGRGAGELISEGALAVEMGATAEDLALTIHPHPTLSETVMESAEVFFDTQLIRFQKIVMCAYNSNHVASRDAGMFGLPFSYDESDIVILPFPWDLTCSYGDGASTNVEDIKKASLQLDLWNSENPDLWKRGFFLLEKNKKIARLNTILRKKHCICTKS